jgi:hypothetical protein
MDLENLEHCFPINFGLSAERITEKYRLCGICNIYFRGCEVYVETQLDYGVFRVPLRASFHCE